MTKKTTALVAALLILIVFGASYFISRPKSNPQTSQTPTSTNSDKSSGKSVNLSGRQLTELAASVMSQTDITSLNLSNNQLTTLPAAIGNMKNLEVLNIENNRLDSLPAELENLTGLKMLDISNNRLPVEQIERIKAKLVNTEVKT